MEWISINDRLPEMKKRVIVKDKFGNIERGFLTDEYVPNKNYWCVFTVKILSSNVTHWKEEENEEQ